MRNAEGSRRRRRRSSSLAPWWVVERGGRRRRWIGDDDDCLSGSGDKIGADESSNPIPSPLAGQQTDGEQNKGSLQNVYLFGAVVAAGWCRVLDVYNLAGKRGERAERERVTA